MSPQAPDFRASDAIVERRYRCGTAARWLPRSLGGAVLVLATLTALDLDPAIARMLPFVRQLVLATGALLAWGIVRGGAEVHVVFGLARDALVVGTDGKGPRLRFEDIERVGWAPSMSGSLAWIPAAVLTDRSGTVWRLPGLLEDGGELVRELVKRAGRSDLETWVEVYRLSTRLNGARARLGAGYGVVVGLLLLGTLHWLS